MSVISNNQLAGAAGQGGADAGYQIDRSLRFNSSDSAYLNRTPSSAGNRRTWTWSAWVKLSSTSTGRSRLFGACGANTGSPYNFATDIGLSGNKIVFTNSANDIYTTDAVFRDFSAWYHIVVTLDTTDATTANRVKIYVNGVLQDKTHPGHGGAGEPSQNTEYAINNTDPHNSGSTPNTSGTATSFFDGYLADVHFIDGQALDPTDFGEFDANNVWQAKEVSITSPNDGTTWSNSCSGTIYNSSLGYANAFDGSLTTYSHAANGNTITFTPSSAIPVSSSVRIFCALGSITGSTGTADVTINGTSYVATADTNRSDGYFIVTGITSITSITWERAADNDLVAVSAIEVDGEVLIDGYNNSTGYGTNGFHLDFSDNSNNAALGYDAAVEAPTVNPDGGFDVVTYTGNGSTQTISGLAFQPDFVWTSVRDQTGYNKYLIDSVRGSTKVLISHKTDAESTQSTGITSFNSDGFSVGSNAQVNENGRSMVAWCWKAGGTASSNTDGTITSQVSANTTYGFSVVTYSGTLSNTPNPAPTVGHGLNAAPQLIISKSLNPNGDDGGSWYVNHTYNYDNWYRLNLTNAGQSIAASGGGTTVDPTSSVFSTYFIAGSNCNNNNYVAYCWSEVAGFSKFSSYSGNGSNTGTVVTTGFKPRYVLIKGTSSARDWWIYDSQRDPSNPNMARLSPNSNSAEATNVYAIDFLDNGFQLKTSDVALNGSGETYIYAAFADRPGNNWDVNNLIATAGLSTANQGFDAVTYTGNGSTQTISGLNFSPDLVWIKMRSTTGYSHKLVDQVRGATKSLVSNNSNAELTETSGLTAFTSDGFSLGSQDPYNRNNDTFVAWCWKAGGTASSNTDGSITSQVSASTDYGFSICTYTGNGSGTANSDSGDSFGHGLSSAPKFILVKRRNSANGWPVYHASTALGALSLNSANALDTGSYLFAQQHPSSSVVYLGNNPEINATGSTYVAYCWSEVPGFSKFGSFTHASTTSLNLGFKPKFFLIKETDGTTPWYLFDAERDSFDDPLFPNTSDAEANGFAFTANDSGISWVSGSLNAGTYIYAAFAGTPPGEIIDILIDTPTNYEADSGNNGGNYATLNPLQKSSGSTLSNGNLDISMSSAQGTTFATMAFPASGKYYFECTANASQCDIGIAKAGASLSEYLGNNASGYGYYVDGNVYHANSSAGSGASYGSGDIIGVAFDADAGTCKWYKNNALQVTISSLSGEWFPAFGAGSAAGIFNFGQRSFQYTPPTGFKSLCTTNLPDPTIADGSTYFDTKLYTGNGSSQTISGFSFSPDFAWFKNRATTKDPRITDTIRGTGVELYSNSTSGDYSQPQGVTAFNSDGVSVGSDGGYNGSGQGMVLWAWDAGSSNTSISAGSLNSSLYNQTDWSGSTTTTNIATNTGNDLASVFDGNLANGTRAANNGGTGTLQWSSGTIQGNVRVYTGLAGTQGLTYYNGSTSTTIASVNNGWNDLGNIDLTRLDFVYSGSNITFVNGIELNGKLLVQTGVTLPSVPTIASTVRANPSAGFSIVSYTGTGAAATVAHGLNAAPEFIITKARSNATNWVTGHTGIGWGNFLFLDTTDAAGASAAVWNNTAPTSSVFSLASSSYINPNGSGVIAYCFAPVEGYSAFGSYTGNGSSDGPFVYTGFRPRWLLLRCSSLSQLWLVLDSARDEYNIMSKAIQAHVSDAEIDNATNYGVDFTSNGFKIRSSTDRTNGSGQTYIYAAFAENPFKTARAR